MGGTERLTVQTKLESELLADPYLLRGIEITRPNQVWAMDITYIIVGTQRRAAAAR
jgi:hypothetical protein